MRVKSGYRRHLFVKLESVISSPLGLALSFGFLATTTSVVAAYLEGRLMVPQQVNFATGVTASIVPFSRNLSTILDFVLLNSLVIYFLQRSRMQWREVNRQLSLPRGFSAYHRVGISIVCFAL